MLVSEATITVKGGHGGPGKVSFFPMKRGPSGGNGGRGGDVYAVVNTNIPDLRKYIEKQTFKAEAGKSGFINRMHGAHAPDLILQMPPNTTIQNVDSGEDVELTVQNPKILLCRGGIGGRGNDAFKTPTNQTPRRAEPGREGEFKTLKLILKLIADYGLIGLPNVGKSTLLNMLTAAQVKTADYHFTTLEPNLGVYNKKILADIPGLIEGASKGKGLGIKFLRHIEKVTMILHCIAADSNDVIADYHTVRNELASHSEDLLTKDEVILLTKTDTITDEQLEEKMSLLAALDRKILPITVFDDTSLQTLKDLIE